MNWRRTRAVFLKELRHIVRDVRSLIMAIALPLVMLLAFGWALSLDVDRVPTLVYDADLTPRSREMVERFRGSRFFDVLGYVDGYAPLESAIDRGEALLGVVIPRGYGAGRNPSVQVVLDGSDSNTAAIALSYVQALERAGIGRRPRVETRLRVWYNSTLESRNYVVPGLIAVILMIIAALLTSLTIAREWEMGTMEQLLSTPLRPAEIVFGKMAAFFLLGVTDTLISVAVGLWIFGVPFRGSVVLLAATGCVFLCGALFWGIFISAATRSQLLAYQLGFITSFLPAFLLSGFVYSIENMPPVIQAISHIFPARYFVTTLKGIFLKGVGLEVLWADGAFLVAYSTLVFLLANRKMRQKVA
ncbi:MAG: ABC transporter permease [Bryobacteraceae bacterium]